MVVSLPGSRCHRVDSGIKNTILQEILFDHYLKIIESDKNLENKNLFNKWMSDEIELYDFLEKNNDIKQLDAHKVISKLVDNKTFLNDPFSPNTIDAVNLLEEIYNKRSNVSYPKDGLHYKLKNIVLAHGEFRQAMYNVSGIN